MTALPIDFDRYGKRQTLHHGGVEIYVDYDDVDHVEAQATICLVRVSDMLLKAVRDAGNPTPAMKDALKEFDETQAWLTEIDPIEEDE